MKRQRLAAALIIVALCACNRESPTEPAPLQQQLRPADAVASDPPILFTMSPEVIILRPGETRVATIRALFTYPLGAEFISVDKTVVLISGRIDPGKDEGSVEIKGVSEGRSPVWINVPNFGRPAGLHQTGSVVVTSAETRRRSVRR